jgi:predicted DNA-binding protein with PD1-like motif
MHCRRVGEDAYLVVLDKEEKVVASILKVAASHSIEGGWVQGLGSVKTIALGYYDLPKRTYLKRKFDEDMELSGLTGNLGMDGSNRVLHAHCSVSGPELISFSGHLFEARVAVTAEFLVKDLGVRLDRAEDPSIGLKLIQPAPGKARKRPGKRAGKRKGAGA